MKEVLSRIDNDTLIIVGLLAIAMVYAFIDPATSVTKDVVLIFGGYLGGQYVATRKE